MPVVQEVSHVEPTNLYLIKIGGNELDESGFLARLVQVVRDLSKAHKVVIVHGGGKTIRAWQERLGLQPRYVEGLRVTDEDSLEVVEAVLCGLVNKRLVTHLVNANVPAVGISGTDAGLVRVQKMRHPQGDLGRVGEVTSVRPDLVLTLLDAGLVPVISPVSLGKDGLIYNVNADPVAQALAIALRAERLYFVSNVPGVLVAGQPIRAMTTRQAEAWIDEDIITSGMIPKVRAAVGAVEAGVGQAVITNLEGMLNNDGTAVLWEY